MLLDLSLALGLGRLHPAWPARRLQSGPGPPASVARRPRSRPTWKLLVLAARQMLEPMMMPDLDTGPRAWQLRPGRLGDSRQSRGHNRFGLSLASSGGPGRPGFSGLSGGPDRPRGHWLAGTCRAADFDQGRDRRQGHRLAHGPVPALGCDARSSAVCASAVAQWRRLNTGRAQFASSDQPPRTPIPTPECDLSHAVALATAPTTDCCSGTLDAPSGNNSEFRSVYWSGNPHAGLDTPARRV